MMFILLSLQYFSKVIDFTLIFFTTVQCASLYPGQVISMLLENSFKEDTVGFFAILNFKKLFLLETA